MIAKLERTQSYAYQNKEKLSPLPQTKNTKNNNGKYIKQIINNNRITALEGTAV